MTMYVLTGEIQYEGQVVLGVYSTQELAEAAARLYDQEADGQGYHSYDVHQVVLDSDARDCFHGTSVEV